MNKDSVRIKIVSLEDIMKHPNMSLSPSDYLGKKTVECKSCNRILDFDWFALGSENCIQCEYPKTDEEVKKFLKKWRRK